MLSAWSPSSSLATLFPWPCLCCCVLTLSCPARSPSLAAVLCSSHSPACAAAGAPLKHLRRWQCLMDTSLSTGTVAVWNLLTKSLLQCVHQPDASLKLYPFQCFLAHDQAVRSIEWCKADR